MIHTQKSITGRLLLDGVDKLANKHLISTSYKNNREIHSALFDRSMKILFKSHKNSQLGESNLILICK